MNETEIFNCLLKEIAVQYNKSIIKEKGLYYSLSSTKLKKSVPLIVGFNWGGTGKDYMPQTKYPTEESFKDVTDLGSLERTKCCFKHFYKEGLNAVQTNFCFFRSPNENDISNKDLNLTSPIFESLVNYLEPKIIISFSSKLRDFFIKLDKENNIKTKIINIDGGNSVMLAKGKVKFSKNEYDFIYLPHPNYPLKSAVRTKAWNYIFNKNIIIK